MKRFSSYILVLLLVFSESLFLRSQARPLQNRILNVRVLEGHNRVIKPTDRAEFLVEVRDGEKPLPGVEVTFVAPESGPGVLFAGNSPRLTVRADSQGRAVSGPTRQVGGEGPFTITIVAMAQDSTGTASAQASNKTPDASGSTNKKSKKWMWLLIAAGGAAGVAVAAVGKSGSEGAGGSGADPGGTPTTVTVGPPTVGAPQ